MIVYLALLIPVILAILLYVLYRHALVWWEVTIPMGVTLVFILLAKWIAVSSLTSDTEWLGGYVTEVRYYEPWDEEVPCRHPIYCKREVCSGSGKERECHDEEYECGHEHAYDVDYHSQYWSALTTLGGHGLSQSEYNKLVDQFGSGKQFVDQHRDFHSVDGDMYSTMWGGEEEKLEPVVQSHTYENRPAASKSIYHYDEVDTFDIKTYKPFDYPKLSDYKQKCLLGFENTKAEHELQVLNSLLGHNKEVRVYVLVFRNQSREAGLIQQRYWQGGNKNEIVVCIGLNNVDNIQWSHVFSWTERTGVAVKIKNKIEESDSLDLSNSIGFIRNEINTEWERKHFKEFDYITIEPSSRAVLIIYILALLINVGLGFWIVLNEINDQSPNKRKKHWN